MDVGGKHSHKGRRKQRYLTPSLPQSLLVRPLVLWTPAPWVGRQGWGAEWNSPNPRGDGEIPDTPLTHIYGARLHPTKGAEGAGGSAHQAPFIYQQSCLTGKWLEVGKSDVNLQGPEEDAGYYRSIHSNLGARDTISHSTPGETGCSRHGWVHCSLGKKVAGWSVAEWN